MTSAARTHLFAVGFAFISMTGGAAAVQTNEIEAMQRAQYDQIEHYLERQIAQADPIREASWKRDFSSVAAYEKSIEPWRQKLIELLGGIPYTNTALNPKEELISDFPSHRAYRVWI